MVFKKFIDFNGLFILIKFLLISGGVDGPMKTNLVSIGVGYFEHYRDNCLYLRLHRICSFVLILGHMHVRFGENLLRIKVQLMINNIAKIMIITFTGGMNWKDLDFVAEGRSNPKSETS